MLSPVFGIAGWVERGRGRGGRGRRGSGIKRWQHKSEHTYIHIAASWKGKWKVPHSNRLGIGILALV